MPSLEPGGYHVFTRCGERFVYIARARRFYHIDELAFALLTRCRTQPLSDARQALLSAQAYSSEAIDEVCAEIEHLAGEGLFDPPERPWTAAWVESAVENRLKGATTRLQLALTESCNLACKYCYNGTCRDVERQGAMPAETAQRALEWLIDASRDEPKISLTLFGGEPLLNQPVFRFLTEAGFECAGRRGKQLRFSMTTNGTLLSDEVITAIKRHGFGLLISMDGPPEVHDRQRPYKDGRGSAADVVEGVRRLRRQRSRVTVRCTLSKNAPRLLDLVEYFERLGFTRIGFAPATNPMAPTALDCERAEFEEFHRQYDEEILDWMVGQFETGKIPIHFPYASFIREQGAGAKQRRRHLPCGVTRGQTTVGADGVFYPCHRFLGMSHFRMGHISQGPDHDRIRRFWRDYYEALAPACGACWAHTLCNGSCAWGLATAEGGFRQPDSWRCAFIRKAIERSAYVLWLVQEKYPQLFRRLAASSEDDEPDSLHEVRQEAKPVA